MTESRKTEQSDDWLNAALSNSAVDPADDSPIRVTDPEWHASGKTPAFRPYTSKDNERRASGEYDGVDSDA